MDFSPHGPADGGLRDGNTGLDELRTELSDLRLVLKLLPSPVAILDERGVVLFTSAPADAILAKQNRLVIVNQKLTATLPRHAKALEAAVQEAARYSVAARPQQGRVQPLQLEVSEHHTVRLSFLPLPSSNRAPRVLVVLLASDDSSRLNPQLIAQLHGLTPTESLLAAALAEGRTLTQYAAERGCSEQTARVHLRSILEKTGTHRQAELVGVLMRSAALHLVVS